MVIRKDNARVVYATPVTTPPDQDVKSSMVEYKGEAILYDNYVHAVDKSQYIPWDKVFNVTDLED
jgi:hypothetical protein